MSAEQIKTAKRYGTKQEMIKFLYTKHVGRRNKCC